MFRLFVLPLILSVAAVNGCTNIGAILQTGKTLEQNSCLRPLSGTGFLLMQADCNLVLYWGDNENNAVLWATGTNGLGTAPCSVTMQADNNLVLYDSRSRSLWASNTNQVGAAGAYAVLQLDRNFIVRDGNGRELWSSKSSTLLNTTKMNTTKPVL